MKNIKKILALLAVSILCMGMLMACGKPSSSESKETVNKAKSADSLIISLGSECCDGNFDPTQKSGKAYDFFHTGLMKINQDLKVVPDLAESYELSGDNLTYTFHLRKDVKFSDGSELTANDVAFTYKTAKESGLSINLTAMKQIEATDKYTVKITLDHPDSTLLINTAYLGIVPGGSYNKSKYSNNPVGTGKYKLVQFEQGQQMILEENPYYYGNKLAIKHLTVLALDDNMVLAWVKAGKVDLAYIPSDQAGQTIDGFQALTCKAICTEFVNLPTTKETALKDGTSYGNKVTSNLAIRQALNVGINRKELVDNVLNGYGSPSYYFINEDGLAKYEPAFKDGDTKKAMQILQDAGWVDQDGDGIREKDGVKAEFTLNGSAADTERYNLAAAVAQQAKKIGIQIDAKSLDWSSCKKAAKTTPNIYKTGNFEPMDIYRYGYSKVGGVSYYNPSFYANSAVDSNIEKAIKANPQDAGKYWQNTQYDGTTGINVDLPYLSLVFCYDTYYTKTGLNVGTQRLHDINHGGYSIIYNIEDWKWD